MNVALPEVDGRVLARAVSFKAAARYDDRVEANIVASEPAEDRMRYTARLAANWAGLRRISPQDRRVALVMANYPNRDGRLGNGVGLDTPAGTIEVLKAMRAAGYPVADIPADGDALMRHLMDGPTNSGHDGRSRSRDVFFKRIQIFLLVSSQIQIQDEITARWGNAERRSLYSRRRLCPASYPFRRRAGRASSLRAATISIQRSTYHHLRTSCRRIASLAFFLAAVNREFGAHAVVHMGKHGNLEWLPGKSPSAIGEACYPEADPWAISASLSLYRQRSRRRHPGQAAHARRHHRSPDPAFDPRRIARTTSHGWKRWLTSMRWRPDLDLKRALPCFLPKTFLSLAGLQQLDADVNVTRGHANK